MLRTLWALTSRGLVDMDRAQGADVIGDWAPFNAIITPKGEALAVELKERER